MHLKKTLILSFWFGLLICGFTTTLTRTPFAADQLTSSLDPQFSVGALERKTQNLPNHFSMKAKRIESSLKQEISHEVEGELDHFQFFCDKLTMNPKTGLFLDGHIVLVDPLEGKTIYAAEAFIDPKLGVLELNNNPVIVQENGPTTHIRAKKITYQKQSDGYVASLDGPIECIVDNLEIR
ncbi:MAG: hypothetical protein ACOYK9_03295 [Chlamydiia bacterium]